VTFVSSTATTGLLSSMTSSSSTTVVIGFLLSISFNNEVDDTPFLVLDVGVRGFHAAAVETRLCVCVVVDDENIDGIFNPPLFGFV